MTARRRHSRVYILVLLGAVCRLTKGQCEPENCSAQCVPEHWRRQLCVFYSELEDWRETARQCRLIVGEFARDVNASPTDQWNEARGHWDQTMQLWREAAANNGIAVATDISGSGLLDLVSLDNSDIASGDSGDLVTMWRVESEEWKSDLKVWADHAMHTLPEGAGPTTDPRDLWMENLSDWSNGFLVYNTSYYHTCPSANFE